MSFKITLDDEDVKIESSSPITNKAMMPFPNMNTNPLAIEGNVFYAIRHKATKRMHVGGDGIFFSKFRAPQLYDNLETAIRVAKTAITRNNKFEAQKYQQDEFEIIEVIIQTDNQPAYDLDHRVPKKASPTIPQNVMKKAQALKMQTVDDLIKMIEE